MENYISILYFLLSYAKLISKGKINIEVNLMVS